jgi:hypothetical protein
VSSRRLQDPAALLPLKQSTYRVLLALPDGAAQKIVGK